MISSWSDLAELAVERAERLVHQQDARFEDDRARERDPLLLPAGQLAWVSIAEVAEFHQAEGVGHPTVDLGPRPPAHAQGERDVLGGGHVREQRVVLEDHADIPPVGRHARHVAAVDLDRATARAHETGDHPERRRLARPGRPEQRHELPAPDLEIDAVHGDRAPERFTQLAQDQGGPVVRPVASRPVLVRTAGSGHCAGA